MASAYPFPSSIPPRSASPSPTPTSTPTPRLDHLPVEVLSLVSSLLAPPFYPPSPPLKPTPYPAPHVVACLDPVPPPAQTIPQALSSTTKTCSHVLEAARPWLWENVDVRSGRGWLGIVDALTEEVVDKPEDSGFVNHFAGMGAPELGTAFRDDQLPDVPLPPPPQLSSSLPSSLEAIGMASMASMAGMNTLNRTAGSGMESLLSPISPMDLEPGPAPDAHTQSNTIPGGMAQYIAINTSSSRPPSYPYPYPSYPYPSEGESSAAFLFYGSSPPQPPRLSMLLTPPGSRNASPHSVSARLRGRSRSPHRRSVNFETEGISAVLDRSRSVSAHGGYRASVPLQRQSSLSKGHVYVSDSDTGSLSPASPLVAMRTPPKPDPLELDPDLDPRMGTGTETDDDDAGFNVNPELLPPPGPYIRHLSFTNFRTIGSRRSQEEAVRGRFVTAGRLEGVIKNAPNLRSLCMTEYVDSALSYPVLEEIFFRGYSQPRLFRNRSTSLSPSVRTRSLSFNSPVPPSPAASTSQLDPPRPSYVPYEDETEEQKWTRRRVFAPLEALDLTGCVSRAFSEAVDEFGENWLGLGLGINEEREARGRSRSRRRMAESSTDDDEGEMLSVRGRENRRSRRPLFTALRRLSLRACTHLPSPFIQNLILCAPSLTHLDLSGTRVTSSFLVALTQNASRGLRLESISLARCPRLDPSAVVDFLVDSPVARDLIDLNLFVDPTQGNSIESHDLFRLLKEAPCIRSGRLRYLDLSSAAFTPNLLDPAIFPPQPSLVSLGLSHIPTLTLRPIASFLQTTAPGVEILTLTGTAVDDLRPGTSTLQITLALHAHLINPLTTMPFSLSRLDLSGPGGAMRKVDLSAGPTRLRVVELSAAIRRAISSSQGSGRTEWQVVKAKGGRGWYVDVSAGWIPSDTVSDYGTVDVASLAQVGQGVSAMSFVRHLPTPHPRRAYLTALAMANGIVRSDVGWHSRKMEVVRGEGMMGREEGMGGVGAFAYEE